MKSFLVGLCFLSLATVALIAASPLVAELAWLPVLIGGAFAVGVAIGLFAPEPLIPSNGHPRSIFETRRAGLH
ncbi:hypothetical protein VO57_008860 [Citromicrobium bathyomarinum]|nr:hypothetical protein [Citromicrobium sp. JL2201]KPM22256.1 hypothetical protein VO57_12465 [Citromicrobium sp. JL2201]